MLYEFHYPYQDYSHYADFSRFDPSEDKEIAVSIAVPLYPVWNDVIERICSSQIFLYCYSKEEGKSVYWKCDKPRKVVATRVLLTHLALEYWTKITRLYNFDDIEKRAKNLSGYILFRYPKALKYQRLDMFPSRRVHVVMSPTARGIFSKPSFFGCEVFSVPFAVNYCFAKYVLENELCPAGWRNAVNTVFETIKSYLSKVWGEVRKSFEFVVKEGMTIEDILISYLSVEEKLDLSNLPLDFITAIYEQGYTMEDIHDALEELYQSGDVTGKFVMVNGRRLFKEVWLKK